MKETAYFFVCLRWLVRLRMIRDKETTMALTEMCGNCGLFKPRIGEVEPEICRAPYGALLGSRKPDDPCVKPGYFQEKENDTALPAEGDAGLTDGTALPA